MKNISLNYLNTHFISMLLKSIQQAFVAEQVILRDKHVTRWGRHDDFIYSEVLATHFSGLMACEREAVMAIIREVINASAKAYSELIEEGYNGYEEDLLSDTLSYDELIESLKVDDDY